MDSNRRNCAFKEVKISDFRRYPSTTLFFLFIGFLYIFILMQIFIPALQRQNMKQFHFEDTKFSRWAVSQFLPRMYNYANEIFYAYRPININHLVKESEDQQKVYHAFYNHHPLRFITFSLNRKTFFSGPKKQYLAIRSRYLQSEKLSQYVLNNKGTKITIEKLAHGHSK